MQAALQYRDRARERREKFGLPDPPSPTYPSKAKLYDDFPPPVSAVANTAVSFAAGKFNSKKK